MQNLTYKDFRQNAYYHYTVALPSSVTRNFGVEIILQLGCQQTPLLGVRFPHFRKFDLILNYFMFFRTFIKADPIFWI